MGTALLFFSVFPPELNTSAAEVDSPHSLHEKAYVGRGFPTWQEIFTRFEPRGLSNLAGINTIKGPTGYLDGIYSAFLEGVAFA